MQDCGLKEAGQPNSKQLDWTQKDIATTGNHADILEHTKDWYRKNVYEPMRKVNPTAAKAQLANFQSIYQYYDRSSIV